jgi:hypothetical protein
MPLLRLTEAFQETVRLCVNGKRYRNAILHRQTEFMWDVRHGKTAFSLINLFRACRRRRVGPLSLRRAQLKTYVGCQGLMRISQLAQ